MNTTLNPKTKVRECSMTVRSMRRSADCSSSTLVPEINDTYPGTSGSTHGDRNDKTPARNAARGRGKLCMAYSNNASILELSQNIRLGADGYTTDLVLQTLQVLEGYTNVPDLATGLCGRIMAGLRRPDQVSEITIESPGLCGSYLTEAGKPRRQE